MSGISVINPKAEAARHAQALAMNISGAKGLQSVLSTNLGPKGTMKMLVSGAGDIKITKDGNVLLHEMQIQHPTASLIAKASTAQNDETGDGTTSTVLIIGELLKQADRYVSEGLHPRIVADGYRIAQAKTIEVLESMRFAIDPLDRTALLKVSTTCLRTKLKPKIADQLAEICVDAVLAVRREGKPIDLHMVEIMEMRHKTEEETKLIRGLVMDHGARHPDMKKLIRDAYVLTCNVSLEYEKTTVHSGFFYKSAEERERLVGAERKFIDDRVQKIVDLKKELCGAGKDAAKGFVIFNQQGIDPTSLDALAKEGIVALRRTKKRNMERLTLACGGVALNSFEGINRESLGHAGLVYEHVIGEDKYTFVEELENARSVTILIKASTNHGMAQIKEAIYDGLRSVKNAIDDACLIPGAGAFELAAHAALVAYKPQVEGKAQLAIQAFADALLIIPKTLANNAGFDQQDVLVKLMHAMHKNGGKAPVGVGLNSGDAINPVDAAIFDNYRVKRQLIDSCSVIASNLLLVDEIMRAGLTSLKGEAGQQ